MRYELTDHEWTAIRPMLPNKKHSPLQKQTTRCGRSSLDHLVGGRAYAAFRRHPARALPEAAFARLFACQRSADRAHPPQHTSQFKRRRAYRPSLAGVAACLAAQGFMAQLARCMFARQCPSRIWWRGRRLHEVGS